MAKNKSLIKKRKQETEQQFHLLDISQTTKVFYSKTILNYPTCSLSYLPPVVFISEAPNI